MLPPGPDAHPLRQVYRWMYRPTEMLDECSARYGSWFTMRFPRGMTIAMTSEPDAIRDLFAGDPDSLLAGAGNKFFKYSLGTTSILTVDGQPHRRLRRLMMPPFHGERMRAYAQDISDLAAERVRSWPKGRELRLHEEFQHIALEVILKTIFGLKPGEGNELRGELTGLLDENSSPWVMMAGLMMLDEEGRPPYARFLEKLGRFSAWGRLVRRRRRIDELLQGEIEKRRAAGGGEDILSMFVEARDEHGDRLEDHELRDQMVTLLLAGHETTATSLAWTFRRLSAEPEALAWAKRLEPAYLDAVASEALRLHPVVPMIWRQLTKPASIAGRELPAGVAVGASIYLAHRRPEVWPEPERFRPERFLERKFAPWEYLPFGGGGRRCLGMAFAQLEMRLIMAEVLRHADLKAAPGRSKVARRSVTLAPHDGGPVVLA